MLGMDMGNGVGISMPEPGTRGVPFEFSETAAAAAADAIEAIAAAAAGIQKGKGKGAYGVKKDMPGIGIGITPGPQLEAKSGGFVMPCGCPSPGSVGYVQPDLSSSAGVTVPNEPPLTVCIGKFIRGGGTSAAARELTRHGRVVTWPATASTTL